MYLFGSRMQKYFEISMYPYRLRMLRYMEISMYLCGSRIQGYMGILKVPPGHRIKKLEKYKMFFHNNNNICINAYIWYWYSC